MTDKKSPRTEAPDQPSAMVASQQLLPDRNEELVDEKKIFDACCELYHQIERGFSDQWERANSQMDYWDIYNCELIPRWLDISVNGAPGPPTVNPVTVYISSKYCTIASTTTVTGANTSNGQMTLSADISGTQPAGQGFEFWTGSQGGTPLGHISMI